MSSAVSPLRLPRMAGTWYPADAAGLASLVDACLAEAAPHVPRLPGTTHRAGVMAPHAGYLYSGRCAGHAYATLASWRPERVVVVAPSHREAFAGVCLWSARSGQVTEGCWRTPLGDVEVDGAFAARLAEILPELRLGSAGHGAEHSLELQLPFLQRALGTFRLVPLVMGDQRPATVEGLSRGLARALDGDPVPTVLVASTDLSHFHDAVAAMELDGRFLRLLEGADQGPLLEALAAGRCEACGGGPVAAVLGALRQGPGRITVQVLDHRDSSRVNGDEDSVVGYAAALIREEEHGG